MGREEGGGFRMGNVEAGRGCPAGLRCGEVTAAVLLSPCGMGACLWEALCRAPTVCPTEGGV